MIQNVPRPGNIQMYVFFVHVYADDDEGLHILFNNEFVRIGRDAAEVEEIFAILAVDDRIAKHLLIAWRQVDANMAICAQQAAWNDMLVDRSFENG